ncbi:hypothetical protein EW145_g1625 [Phellinidium pouzarii]|uniref:Bacteriophage T5 Orf172 DNA-binding domain-containing protein n=1 Tax=Phellinidium pouzarii TaxID=167371 RepID=A0A4S4LDT2_9AGAM|nr:hypothetical protein EW145_g1625 [Phellinidium pouzarii]
MRVLTKFLDFFLSLSGSTTVSDKDLGKRVQTPPPLPPKDDLLEALSALNISGQTKQKQGFIGGFRHEPTNPDTDHKGYFPPVPPPFPAPSHVKSPMVPLPRPPAMLYTMPEPQLYTPSRTMRYALQSPDGPSNSALLHPNLSAPSFPPRSTSDCPRPSLSTDSSPERGQRLNASRHARPRADSTSSAPPSTSADSPSGRKKAIDERIQCNGMTKKGERCSRQVRADPPLNIVDPAAPTERFCFQHQKEVMEPSGFYSRTGTRKWVEFSEWIPIYLHPETQAALRVEMEKPQSASDVPGYIYAFEIRDEKTPSVIKLKVGRAVKLVKRIDEWSKQCGSKEQVLRGWWPGTVENGESEISLMKGRVKPGVNGPCCHRLERLIHLELADLVVYEPYLREGFPNLPGSDLPGSETCSAPASSPSTPTLMKTKARAAQHSPASLRTDGEQCSDCGANHKEIFTFTRPLKGPLKGNEWDKIVKPVIEKWGRFVDQYMTAST